MTGEIFGRGGGRELAAEAGIPFLGEIPLDVAVRVSGDEGTPTVVSAPESPAAQALEAVAAEVRSSVSI